MFRMWLRRMTYAVSRTPAGRRPPARRQPSRPRVEVLEDRTLLSANLLGDLNTTATASSSPNGIVNLNGSAFFFADDGTHGYEPWKSSGGTTQLVKDINPGDGSSVAPGASDAVVLGGNAYFFANDGTHGYQLWKSDGSAGNTVAVTNLTGTTALGSLQQLTVSSNQLFFTSAGRLYVSDGSSGATVLTDSSNNPFVVSGAIGSAGGVVYFQGHLLTSVGGDSLWKTDGTPANTTAVQSLPSGALVTNVTGSGGTVYLALSTPGPSVATEDVQLWGSDGTSAGLLHDFGPVVLASPQAALTLTDLTDVGGRLFFAADDHTVGSDLGTELWTSDGTANTTQMVKDLNGGPGNGLGFDAAITSFNGVAYFVGTDGTHGPELFVSDGTAANTLPVTDLAAHPFAAAQIVHVAGGSLYFAGSNAEGTGLWKLSGAGTGFVAPVVGIDAGPGTSADVGGTLTFAANDGSHGDELWKSDGTAAGTQLVKDINPFTSSDPADFTAVGSTVYFSADDGVHGRELWATDGTPGSAHLVADINPGRAGGLHVAGGPELTNVNGTLYFFAYDGNPAHGAVQLWTSTGSGAQRVAGFASGLASELTNVNGTAFFAADDGTHGLQLWQSSGSGAQMVPGLNTSGGSNPGELTAVGSTLFFVATDGTHTGLWKTDGTTTTFLQAGASELVNAAGTLYFTVDDPTNGAQLWKLAGTTPTKIKDVGQGVTVDRLLNVGGTAFFVATSSGGGSPTTALWASNGTQGSTVSLHNFAGDTLSDLVALGSALFFIDTGSGGSDLWTSNGTVSGTLKVGGLPASNLDPPGGGTDYQLTSAGGTLFFAASDSSHGQELWRSDGSAAGTLLAADIQAGAPGSAPRHLTGALGKLFFGANDGLHGNEPYVATPDTRFAVPTSTAVTASPQTVTAGQQINFTATVTPMSGTLDGGTVDFRDGSTDLGSLPVTNGTATLPVSTLGVGTHSIIAYYLGDTAFAASASLGVTVTVNPSTSPAPTTTTLTVAPSQVPEGQAVLFTATVKPASGNVDGGSVDFQEGSFVLGTVQVNGNGVATLNRALAPGKHQVIAYYSGDPSFDKSQSSAVGVTVAARTATQLTASAQNVTAGQPVVFTATVSADVGTVDGGSVDFKDGAADLGAVPLSGNVATLTASFGVGTHDIRAIYLGDASFQSSTSSSVTVTASAVTGQVPTSTTETVSATSIAAGGMLTFTATVSASGGPVSGGNVDFKDGATDLGSFAVVAGTATLTTSSLGVGTHDVVAVYLGTPTFAASASSGVSVTVTSTSGTATGTSLQTSATTANPGQPVTLSATVTPSSGTLDGGSVDFKDGQTDLGSYPVDSSGVATLTTSFAIGAHQVTAVYTGDANFAGSTSSSVTVTVSQQSGTNTTLTASASTVTLGQAVTLTATVKPPQGNVNGGTVDFMDGTTDLGTVQVDPNGVATLTKVLSPAGAHPITAIYSGDADFSGSQTSTPTTVTVTQSSGKAGSSILFTVAPTGVDSATPITLKALVTAVGSSQPVDGGTVTFLDGGVVLGTMAVNPGNGTATLTTLLGAGLHNLIAVYSGDPSYEGVTSGSVPVTVTSAVPVAGDVTASVGVDMVPTFRGKKAGWFTETLTLTNNGLAPVLGPINVVLRGLRSNIKVRGAHFTGPRKRRTPYVVFNPAGGMLMPGHSMSMTVQFSARPNFFFSSVFASALPG
jgi:ELWxxDGT repeat protein